MAPCDRHRGHPRVTGELVRLRGVRQLVNSYPLGGHLALEQIAPSIGPVGDAYDNVLTDSIVGHDKTECIPRSLPRRIAEDRRRRRRHDELGRVVEQPASALNFGMRTPGEQEQTPTGTRTEQFNARYSRVK